MSLATQHQSQQNQSVHLALQAEVAAKLPEPGAAEELDLSVWLLPLRVRFVLLVLQRFLQYGACSCESASAKTRA